MVNNEGETPTTSSGATAQAAATTSSNRPIVMPEAFSAAGHEEWDSWLSHFEDWGHVAPTTEFITGRAGRLYRFKKSTS